MSRPLFSIITVCLNSEQTIEKFMRSVLSQSFVNYELIIIDGASKDGTLELINKFEGDLQLNGIKYYILSEKDNGIYDAMNKGMQYANGLYTLFLNSDDKFYDRNALCRVSEKVLELMNQDVTIDIIYCGIELLLHKYGRLYSRKLNTDEMNLSSLESYMAVQHQSCLFRTSLLRERSFNQNYKIGADYDYILRAYREGLKFIEINSIITTKNITAGDTSSNPILNTLENIKIHRQFHSIWSRRMWTHYKRLILYSVRYLKEQLSSAELVEHQNVKRMIKSGYSLIE